MENHDKPSARDGWLADPARPFGLFLAVSVVLVLAILLVASLGLRFVLRTSVITEAEKDAIRISTALRDSVAGRLLHSESTEAEGLFISPDKIPDLDKEMRSFLMPFHIVKIKVFNKNTRIIYSSDPGIIGSLDPRNAKLAKALSGSPVSKFESKEHVWDLAEEKRPNVDVVETYVPVFGSDGRVVGSFEIYKDVTADRRAAGRVLLQAMVVLLVVVSGVFAILVAFSRSVSRTIRSKSLQLARSENKYRQLFAAETDAILLFDAETDCVVRVNNAAADMYGRSKEDFVGQDVEQVLGDQSGSSGVFARLRLGISRDPIVCEHTKADGSKFPVEVSGGNFVAGDRRTVFVVVRDITRRKEAEDGLARTVQELRQFNNLAVGREERMLELKREVNEMARKAGVAPPYDAKVVEM